jgi:hypothetical protein
MGVEGQFWLVSQPRPCLCPNAKAPGRLAKELWDGVGGAINSLILHGQTHGGIAQGFGQALLKNSY